MILLLSLILACNEPPPPPGTITERPGETVVTIDGEAITSGMVEAILTRLPPQQAEQLKTNPSDYHQFVEQIAVGQRLWRDALKAGYAEKPEMKTKLAMAEQEVLVAAYLEQVGKGNITEQAVTEWYESHKVQFAKPSLKLRHILLKSGDTAGAADTVAKLKAGADFDALAQTVTTDRQSPDLGWVPKGKLLPELDNAVFAGKAGEIIGPVESKHGLHVFRVDERRETIPLEEVRTRIEDQLKQESVKKVIDETKAAAKIEWPGAATVLPGEPPAGGVGGSPPGAPGGPPPGAVPPPPPQPPAEPAHP